MRFQGSDAIYLRVTDSSHEQVIEFLMSHGGLRITITAGSGPIRFAFE
jgi:hypothetical protein